MSVAPETVLPPVPSGCLRPRLSRRVEHLLVALGICLPVPIFAATGLSVPLPGTVERLAAALVPWVDANAVADAQPIPGEIVRTPGERAAASTPEPDSSLMNDRHESAPSTPAGKKQTKDGAGAKGGGGTSGVDGSGDAGSTGRPEESGGTSGGWTSGSGGGSTSGSSGGGLDLGAPVQGVVDTVGETTDPVLDGVGGTVTDVGGTLESALQGTNNTLTGALSGKK
jgi:hypothetical protein